MEKPTTNDSDTASFLTPRDDSVAAQASLPQFSPGDVIEDRYEVMSALGSGGFGFVYRVRDLISKTERALKTLSPLVASDITVRRFRKEGEAARRLDHNNLVRAVDFGMIGGTQPFLVMELVEGPTLAEHLRKCGRIPVDSAMELFIPICLALEYAHGEGIVHRDLKPTNIMLAIDGDDQQRFVPKIVDFGIAKTQFGDETNALTLTTTGEVFGSPLYMSPEQGQGHVADRRSDIYSIGCVLFECLTGAPPFQAAGALEILMQHYMAPIPSLKEASLGLQFPTDLEKVITKMLAKQREDRYSTFAQVARDLMAIQRGESDIVRTGQTFDEKVVAQGLRQTVPRAVLPFLAGVAFTGVAAFLYLTFWGAPPSSTTQSMDYFHNLLEGDADYSQVYFSYEVSGQKVFLFRNPKPLGQLYWWQGGSLQQVPAIDKQTVPAKANLIFEAKYSILMAPYLWGRFHQTDLSGVSINVGDSMIKEEVVDQSVRLALLQDSLKYFRLREETVSRRAWEDIGANRSLRWLDISGLRITEAKLTAGDVAQLGNIRDMTTLVVGQISHPRPLFEVLKDSHIRRLALPECFFTDEDMTALSQIRTLEVLSIHQCLNWSTNPISKLAKLPKLERLVVDSAVLRDLVSNDWQKMEHLKILEVHDWGGDTLLPLLERFKKLLPAGCAVMVLRDDSDGPLFDPLKVDPAKDGIW